MPNLALVHELARAVGELDGDNWEFLQVGDYDEFQVIWKPGGHALAVKIGWSAEPGKEPWFALIGDHCCGGDLDGGHTTAAAAVAALRVAMRDLAEQLLQAAGEGE